jgi:hypothetical protein
MGNNWTLGSEINLDLSKITIKSIHVGFTKDLVYEVEINTKGQLQKHVTDAANQIRKNPEMLNSVYENWYQRKAHRTL